MDGGKVDGNGRSISPKGEELGTEPVPDASPLVSHSSDPAQSGFGNAAASPLPARGPLRGVARFAEIDPLNRQRIGELVSQATDSQSANFPSFKVRSYKNLNAHVRSWRDLIRFLDYALAMAWENEAVEVEIDRYALSPLDPSPHMRARLEALARKHGATPFTLTVKDDPEDPDFIFSSKPSSLDPRNLEISVQNSPVHRGGVFAIGAGQTISLLHPAREIIKRGRLPQNTRLTVIARKDEAMEELRTKGTIKRKLKQPVNPEGQKKILAYHERHRMELLRRQRPDVIFFNVPVSGVFGEEGIMDAELLQYILENKSVIALPCKGADSENQIPYIKLYNLLMNSGHPNAIACANNIVVIGGFYAAPQIMRGDQGVVSVTLTGGSKAACEKVARYLSPNDLDADFRADWEYMEVEVVESVEVAAVTAAAGQYKNILTKWASQMLMKEILEGEGEGADFKKTLADYQKKNLDLAQELVSRIIPHYHMKTAQGDPIQVDHIELPRGVKADFINCLAEVRGLRMLVAYRDAIRKAVQAGKLDEFETLIDKVYGQDTEIGTRNARDGYVDALLVYAYTGFKASGVIEGDYADFWKRYYPPEKLKVDPPEGRKAIRPLIQFTKTPDGKDYWITLPPELYDAFELFFPAEKGILRPKEQRDPGVRYDEEHPAWGLPESWVDKLGVALSTLRERIDRITTSEGRAIVRISGQIETLQKHLEEIHGQPSAYTELTRRLASVAFWLKKNTETLEANRIDPAKKLEAFKTFGDKLKNILNLIEDSHSPEDATEVMGHLLILARNLCTLGRDLQKGAVPKAAHAGARGHSRNGRVDGHAIPEPKITPIVAGADVSSESESDPGAGQIRKASASLDVLMRGADLFASFPSATSRGPKLLVSGSYALAVQEPLRTPKLRLLPGDFNRQTAHFAPLNRQTASRFRSRRVSPRKMRSTHAPNRRSSSARARISRSRAALRTRLSRSISLRR